MVTPRCDRNHTRERIRMAAWFHVSAVTCPRATSHATERTGNLHFASEASRRMLSTESNRSTSRRLRASFLALAVIAVVAAGVLPTCADSLCCSKSPARQTVHSQMPCCEPTIAPRDARLQPVTAAGSLLLPQTWAPVAVVELHGASDFLSPRVQATLATASSAHSEPDPPLFLLNAQFLI